MQYWQLVSCLLFGLCLQTCKVAAPVLLPLDEPNRHAGCYIENTAGEIIANLSEEDDAGNPVGLFHLEGKDLRLAGQDTSDDDDGLQVFANERYRVEVRSTFVEKEPDTCLEYYRFSVVLVTDGRSYDYTFPGFCGC